jgi:site-specific DNA recombinase
MNNKSSADTSRRVKRKHKAMQQAGLPTGGPRPFGWKADRRSLEEAEAEHLREAKRRLLAGEAVMSSVVSGWNRDGILSAKGKRWSLQTAKQVLRNPRICGYRTEYKIEFDPETGTEHREAVPVYDADGKPIMGEHEPIITVEEWEELCALITSGTKAGTGHNARVYLLSGILRCGKGGCGTRLRSMRASKAHKKPEGFFYYMCPSKLKGQGCGGVSIPGPEADELVRKMLIAKHALEAEQRNAVPDAGEWGKERELEMLGEDMLAAREARKRGLITAERYYQDLAGYEAEQQSLIRERRAWQRKAMITRSAPIDIEAEWNREDITLAERRAYIERAYSAIIVLPVGKGSRVPLRDRLDPIPNTEI